MYFQTYSTNQIGSIRMITICDNLVKDYLSFKNLSNNALKLYEGNEIWKLPPQLRHYVKH